MESNLVVSDDGGHPGFAIAPFEWAGVWVIGPFLPPKIGL